MTLLDAVRGGTLPRRTRRGGVSFPPGEWKAAEQALVAELRAAPRSASRFVRRFEKLALADGSGEALGRAARLRGSWLSYVGRDAEAIAPYRDAERRLTGLARDGARLGLAASLTRTGRFAAAKKLCAEVRAAARERGDVLAVAGADLNEGVARHESGDLAGAVGYHRRARDAFAAAGRAAQAAAASDNLGNACVLLDLFDEAEAAYADAAAGFAGAGAANDAARCRMNRASLLVATDRLGEADALLRACEDAFRAAGDALHAALARRDRGEALLRAGLVPEARHALTSAARALTAGAPPAERRRTAALLAWAALAAGDARGARRAVRAVRDPATRREILGRADAADGSTDAAARTLVRAAASHGARSPVARARCLAAASWCFLESGRGPAARRAAAQAERLAEKLRVPGLRFGAAAARFLAERDGPPDPEVRDAAAGAALRRAPAEAALARAVEALESVRDGLGPEAMRAALLRGREAWLAAAVRFLLDGPGGPDRALALLERWRARSLVDLLADAGTAPADERDARVAAIRRVVAGLERRAEGATGPAFLRGSAAGSLRAPLAPSPALLRRLREAEDELVEATGRLRGSRAAPWTDGTPEAIRATLPAGTVVLALFADEHGGLAFVVAREGVVCVPGLGARDVVARDVRDLHFALGSVSLGPDYVRRHEARLRRAVDSALARLAARTLEPVAAHLAGARHLVVVPHGPWHQVPFAALPWQGGRLVEAMPVSVLPALAALRDPPPPATARAVVVAVPDEAAPETSAECDRVGAVLRADRLAGAEATAAALTALDRPRCLHIAAHGRHRPDAPAASGVRLGDGWFRAAEFARLRLAGSLVVLSGCETGLSSVDAGDEVHGLVRGVLAAGASDVVSSLWRVDDAATARFMEEFHTRLAGNRPAEPGAPPGPPSTPHPVAAALAAVQAAHAAAGAHPWLWAGFTHHARALDG